MRAGESSSLKYSGKSLSQSHLLCDNILSMSGSSESIKQSAYALIGQLPDSATWDDVLLAVRFAQAVDEGIAEADQGKFATEEEVRASFSKWGATLEV